MKPKRKYKRKVTSRQFVSVPEGVSVAVMGDVHEHEEQFLAMLNEIRPREDMWLVSLGDIYDKGFGIKSAERMTDELMRLQEKGVCCAVRGNHEVKLIRKARKTPKQTPQLKWWANQPLAITFNFANRTTVTALHAGVTPLMTESDLGHGVEVVYIRDVDEEGQMIPLVWKNINGVQTLVKSKEGGSVWHDVYDGRFGYIVSGHAAQRDGEAKLFNYSSNLDSGVYDTGILTAQIFNDEGKSTKLVTVKGTAFKPELNINY